MVKKFKIEVDCANCAALIEQTAKKVPGVRSATVSFMAQKMMLEAAEEEYEAVLARVVKAAKKVEPDFEIVL